MLFCYFRNFDFSNLRMTFAKKLLDTETSNLQVKFYFSAAFHNWHLEHYHYFTLRLIRPTQNFGETK